MPNKERKLIKYYAPWWNFSEIENNKIDFIFSTAVMEHIEDLDSFYQQTYNFLKPNGYLSSVIDYGAHEFSNNWFEHYYYSDNFWKFLMHGRKYIINRRTHSEHLKALEKSGFEIVTDRRSLNKKADFNRITKSIKDRFNEEDLQTKSGIILAKKI